MNLTAEERAEYIRAIWATFQHVHKVTREISNAEYMLARSWATGKVPLGTVLRGITETTGSVRRLGACERAVNENIARWFQAMGGL